MSEITNIKNLTLYTKTGNKTTNKPSDISPEDFSVWDGKFCLGMTKDQAIKNGTYSSMTERSFKDIDKDENGILTIKEIVQEKYLEGCRELFKNSVATTPIVENLFDNEYKNDEFVKNAKEKIEKAKELAKIFRVQLDTSNTTGYEF